LYRVALLNQLLVFPRDTIARERRGGKIHFSITNAQPLTPRCKRRLSAFVLSLGHGLQIRARRGLST